MRSQIQVPRYGRALAACIRANISAPFMIIIAMIASSGPALANYASLIMDASNGRVLHETNADLTRYPASLTKMMTLYLLFEALDRGLVRLDEMLPISGYAASQPPSKLGLRPGQSISVENAILALVTKSANDIATVVAEYLAGSEARFAWSMTAKAHEIGMSRTTFANASGLPDPVQVTTARDMAILGLALLHDYPHYYHYFSTDRFYYGGAVHANHNRLLGSYSGLDGIKTGYTSSSGFNLVASAVRDGQRFIGVVLGARSPVNRGIIMADLLDQAFNGGEIIEVREEDSMPPVQAQVANAPLKRAEPIPAQRNVAVLAARSVVAAKMLREPPILSRAPLMAQATTQRPRSTAGKLVSLSRTAIQSAISAKPSGRNKKRALNAGAASPHKQLAIRPARSAPNIIALSGKPTATTALKSQSQVKRADSNSKLAATPLLKLPSASEKPSLRVAEGGRKRSS
jgi:D-alanyl-D-alanine carboxypeptidase